MSFIAEGVAVNLITGTANGLVSALLDVKASVKQNKNLVTEIEDVERDLKRNMTRLKNMLPANVNQDAIDDLNNKVKAAAEFIQNHNERGSIKRIWNAKETMTELQRWRRDINHAFIFALGVTNIEVTLQAGDKSAKIHSEMRDMYARYASDSAQVRSDMREYFDILMKKIHPLDNQLQTVVKLIESLIQAPESDHEVEKFFNDILSSLSMARRSEANSTEDNELYDPITNTVMIDPVKASDGYTYDRWTVIEGLREASPYTREKIEIVVDDVSIRSRLFERRPSAGAKCRERRENYRTEALRLAEEGYDVEALVRLDNVLKWDKNDEGCRDAKAKIRDRQYRGSDRRSSEDLEAHQQRVDQASLLGQANDLMSNQRASEESNAILLRCLNALEHTQSIPQESAPPVAAIHPTPDFRNVNFKAIRATPDVYHKLLDLLTRKTISNNVQEELISVLAELGKSKENLVVFASLPESLETIAGALKRPTQRFWAARTVADLVPVLNPEKIATWLGSRFSIIEKLGGILELHGEEDADARFEALRALSNILEMEILVDEQLRRPLSNRLAKLLLEFRKIPESHLLDVFSILRHLKYQWGKEDRNVEEALTSTPGALDSLLQLFVDHPSLQLQDNAIFLLGTVLDDEIEVLKDNDSPGPDDKNLQERRYLRLVKQLIDDINSSDVARKVGNLFLSSPSALKRLVEHLQLETRVLHQGLVVLWVVTASRKGSTCVAKSSAAMNFISSGFSEATGLELDVVSDYATILGCLCHHSQVDLSKRLHRNIAEGVNKIVTKGKSNPDWKGIGGLLAFFILYKTKNKKAIADMSLERSLEQAAYPVGTGDLDSFSFRLQRTWKGFASISQYSSYIVSAYDILARQRKIIN